VRPAGARLGFAVAALAALAALAPAARADDARRRQEIVLGELSPHIVGDAPFGIGAKATSGLAVSLEVVAGPAAMDGRNIRLTGSPGLVVVRATQDGNATFQPAVPAERVITVRARPAAPAFTLQPSPAVASIGDVVVLSAQASGEPMPAYQWRREGIEVAGATSRVLTLYSATPADAGSYDVTATNASGSATSSRASVLIGRHSQTISFQAPASAQPNQPVLLAASASSGLPVQFQVLSGMASLYGNTVTPQSGTVVIQAMQPGDSNYEAAQPVTQAFQVQQSTVGRLGP
jgi:hypothetical protein